MAMTLRQLRYFLAVAETEKVSEAAANINISPSSVTEAIKDLEYDLDVKLFDRKRTGLKLTHEGFLFLQSAKKVLDSVCEAKQSVKTKSRNIEGELKLCTTVTVSGYFLAGLLERFKRAYPNIKLIIDERSRIEAERRMKLGLIDVGVVLVSNVTDHPDLAKLTLLSSQRRLWLSSNHPLTEKTVVSLEDIQDEPYVQLLIDESPNSTIEFWKDQGRGPNVLLSSGSIEGVRNLVAKGLGITILSDMVYRPWSLDGERIETRAVAESIPSLDTGLIWSRQHEMSPQAKAFIEFCRMEYTSGINRGADH